MSDAVWRDRPVLVTGASGLVGGWLVHRLVDAGADVVCLVRDWVPRARLLSRDLVGRVRLVRGDVRDGEVVERTLGEYEVDTVFHLAAQTIVPIANRNPLSTFSTNVGGTWTVLEGCRRAPTVRAVVVASSDKAYGPVDHLPYTEDTPLAGLHPYDVSKSCADMISRAYAETYALPVAIARCGNFFGGGDLNWSRLVPGTIRSIVRDEPPIIRSDGRFVRDYLYVEDGAAAYTTLAEELLSQPASLRGRAYNFSYETPLTVLALTQRILDLMGSSLVPEVRNDGAGEIRDQYLSSRRAREEIGWKPRYSLDEGLARTISWYRWHFDEAR